MSKPVVATCTAGENQDREALLLVSSVRAFAGRLHSASLWVLHPSTAPPFEPSVERQLAGLGVEVIPFRPADDAPDVPAAARVQGAAVAEERAAGQTDTLLWMDPDTIVLRDADTLLLPEGKTLACSPVHLQLIGSSWDEPVDDFWGLLYERLGVDAGAPYAVTTAVDRKKVRAYFDAGLLVVRPDGGLLRRWQDDFARLCDDAAAKAFFIDDPQYHEFFHQAVLAATVLATVARDESVELPPLVNYPLHLLDQITSERRPWSLNDLVTCRYDTLEYLVESGWRALVRLDEPVRGWLDDTLAGGRARL
jgi:hypothetical protein